MTDCTSLSNQGISIYKLFGSPAKFKDCADAERLIKMNFGDDYPEEKFTMLWEMIVEDGWTKERLQSVLKWFLKNKRYPSWTIADWFDYDMKLYPHSWYLENINKGIRANNMQGYKIHGHVLWCMKGVDLPFPKLQSGKKFN